VKSQFTESDASECNFFNPVPKMKLIELIKAPQTSDETIATCRESWPPHEQGRVVVKIRRVLSLLASAR